MTVKLRPQIVQGTIGRRRLPAVLSLPEAAQGLVIFAHGSGSSRFSQRNQFVARHLSEAGLATLLFDLLTEEEAQHYDTGFDMPLLTLRLLQAIEWANNNPQTRDLRIGLFGASTGAGAALMAAAREQQQVAAVVSRGGRPDLAGNDLSRVYAPTLFIVGSNDHIVLELNRAALTFIPGEKQLEIVEGATHLFPEEGALEQVADLAGEWFASHLSSTDREP